MVGSLKMLFEEQLAFRLPDGAFVDGSVFIGETPFLPLQVLLQDESAYQEEFNRWVNLWRSEMAERRERLLLLCNNRKRFRDLLAAAGRQQLIPIVGSGMSVPSGLPTWSDLLRAIGRETGTSEVQLEARLVAAAFEEAADLVAAATNRNLLDEQIEFSLRIEDDSEVGGAVRLLPTIFSYLVVTTNLDDVLERTYGSCGEPFDYVLTGGDLARFRDLKNPKQRLLLKIHGDCRRAETRVLLTSEYEAAYAPASQACAELALLYQTHQMLFLGSSLGSDRTVRMFERLAASDQRMSKHFAFLPLPHSDEIRIEREHFLTERRIHPIWYDGPHDESIMALLAGLIDTNA